MCAKSASLYSEPVRYSLLLNYLLLCSINTRFQAPVQVTMYSEEEAQPSPWAERSKAGVGPTANKGTDCGSEHLPTVTVDFMIYEVTTK